MCRTDLQRLLAAVIVLLVSLPISGCAALWFGAGAATGVAVEDHMEEHHDKK